MRKSFRSSAFSLVAAVLSSSVTTTAADQTVTWHYNVLSKKSALGEQIKIKQCETLTFEWSEMMPHDVVEFVGGTTKSRKTRLKDCQQGQSGGTKEGLTDILNQGSYNFSPGTSTTWRYLYCSVGSHCSGGGMKAVVRVMPDFVSKYDGFACAVQNAKRLRKFKKLSSAGICRRRCRNNCMGFQYNGSTGECVLYKTAPKRGSADTNVKCWAAMESCS